MQQLSHQEAAGMETDSVGGGACPPRHCGVHIRARTEAETGQVGTRSTWDNLWLTRQGLWWLSHIDRNHRCDK